MKASGVRERAFATPLTSPAYPPGPYRFVNRQCRIITYRTDPEKLRALVPEPLVTDGGIIKYEFVSMPDSTGFGDYTETRKVIPVTFRDRKGGYSHCMFFNDDPPIAGGSEPWGLPKKLADPTLHVEIDMLVGTPDYGPVRVATGSIGYKHRAIDPVTVKESIGAPSFLLKMIRHVDGTPRICELVEHYLEDTTVKGAWSAPAALDLHFHVTSEEQVEAGTAKTLKTFGQLDILVSNASIQIVAPLDEFEFAKWKQMLAIHRRRRLPHHAGRAAADVSAGDGRQRHLHGLGPLQGSLAAQGALRDGQVWPRRPRRSGRQGRCEARRARQRHLPRLRMHATGRQADSRASERARHLRSEGGRTLCSRTPSTASSPRSRTAALFFAAFESNALTGQSLVVSDGWFMQ
jgi:acetoacetate decarboxylase